MSPADYSDLAAFGAAFVAAGCGGLAQLFGSSAKLSRRIVLARMLESGMIGITIAIVAKQFWPAYHWIWLAAAITAGSMGRAGWPTLHKMLLPTIIRMLTQIQRGDKGDRK